MPVRHVFGGGSGLVDLQCSKAELAGQRSNIHVTCDPVVSGQMTLPDLPPTTGVRRWELYDHEHVLVRDIAAGPPRLVPEQKRQPGVCAHRPQQRLKLSLV